MDGRRVQLDAEQGHVSINRFLSTTRSYLSLLRAHGQRIFVERPDGYALLDVPSAYEMSPNGCRWIYKHSDGLIAVRSWACLERHQLYLSIDMRAGAPCRFLIANHIALHGDDGAEAVPVRFDLDRAGIVIRPAPESEVGRRFPDGHLRIDPGRDTILDRVGGDELLFADGRSRQQPYLTIVTRKASSVSFRITGGLIPTAGTRGTVADLTAEIAAEQGKAERFWHDMTGALTLLPPARSRLAGEVARLQEILPWFAHNAMIHYLAPRGLEQYSSGGWGTRDVTQGPVELLLALGRWEPLRDLLSRVYRAQNPDGDWPQWFMFFDRERLIRPDDSHGDIVCSPVLALAEYLLASEDASLLDEVVPFFHPEGYDHAEQTTLWVHVERALAVMATRVIPGTQLAAYGHGDWNDSLQLRGKVAIVTGTGSPIGIGHAITLGCVHAGARVAMLDLNQAWLEQSVREAKDIGGEDCALAIVADVTDLDAVEQAVHRIIVEFGTLHLEGRRLPHNAETRRP